VQQKTRRGRDASYLAPHAQNRTGGFPAYGFPPRVCDGKAIARPGVKDRFLAWHIAGFPIDGLDRFASTSSSPLAAKNPVLNRLRLASAANSIAAVTQASTYIVPEAAADAMVADTDSFAHEALPGRASYGHATTTALVRDVGDISDSIQNVRSI
jgi:hypothetical protein